MSRQSIEAVIDWELDCCAREELEYAWRSLCAMMLVRTASSLGRSASRRKSDALQKKTAKSWLEGGVGMVTFESACCAVDLCPDNTREAIRDHAETARNNAINNTQVVFGRSLRR